MSRATLNKYGGIGALELPGFQPRIHRQILSVCDPGHFMHGKVNVHRYAIEGDSIFALRNLNLSEDIAEKGVEQPGVIWWHDDVGHIISGTRRWTALEVANGLREADSLDPFLMRFEVNSRWSEAVAAEKWRRANQRAIQNDILTRLEGAALDIERGVDPERVAEVWEFSPSQLKRALDPVAGILCSSPDLKAALATGNIKLSAALKIAALPLSEQVAAMNGAAVKIKVGSKKPGAVSTTKLLRIKDALRDDKRLADVTASDIVAWLCGTGEVNEAGLVIGQILTEKIKPSRRPKESP